VKRLLGVVFFLIVRASLVFSQETTSSQIKKVILFTNQAFVTRTAETKVRKGLNELLIELNAFNVDKDSIQAKVYGKGQIYSVQFKEIYLKQEPQEKIRNLADKIQALKDEKKLLVAEKNILDKKDKFINSLLDFSKTQVPQDIKTSFPSLEDLKGILSFLDTSCRSINKNREGIVHKIRDLDKEIKMLESELASLKGPARKTKKVIEILFNSRKEQQIKIEASYLTYNAFWSPFYKANVSLGLSNVDLTMFSKIHQKTGEDWEGVKLFVSNVIPLKGAGLPSLNIWTLDIERRARKQSSFSPMAKIMEEKKDVTTEADRSFDKAEEAGFVSARKKELPLSFEYELPQILNIESKDKETILPLFSKKLKGEFFYYAVPKRSVLTFLACKTTADKELLRGKLNVYFGDRFISKTHLSEKKAGEEFKLSLGADREVKVKREKIKDEIDETFLKKIQRRTVIRRIAFKITVDNLKNKPVKIKVLDSIPVSRTDKIEVKNIKMLPPPTEKDLYDKKGVNLWEFDLNPREKKEINIEFTLTYPKDTLIFGL